MKKHTATLILLAMLASLAACGEAADPVGTTVASDTTVPAETTAQFESDDLPDDLDLGGKTVNLMICNYKEAFTHEMYSEEETGNRLNDAVYNSIGRVKERLNVELVYTSQDYFSNELNTFPNRIIGRIMAGDEDMDIVFDVGNYTLQMLQNRYFIDLSDTAYINIDKPWYNSAIIDALPTDYIYCLTGNFSVANVKHSFCTYFNSDLYATLGHTESLYDIVDAGKWTLDTLESLIKDTYADLNGDTKKDPSDQYGLTFGDNNKYIGIPAGCDLFMYKKSADGYEFTYDNEHAMNVMERLWRLVRENENVHDANDLGGLTKEDWQVLSDGGNYVSKPFVEGKVLFSMALVGDAATIVPESDFKAGLLPLPKYDEEQKEYRTVAQRSCYALIPVSSADYDSASAVLEALSSEFYRVVIPEYFEITLKTRYSPDENDSRMFDLITESCVFEVGDLFDGPLGSPYGLYKDIMKEASPTWASMVAKNKEKWAKAMEDIMAMSW
ncbi:MAG: hypothetical protein E7632_08195 [Ruminococcaceae bacterium]|nr:hypothetical protein [Oscillospiraceae bacterium]